MNILNGDISALRSYRDKIAELNENSKKLEQVTGRLASTRKEIDSSTRKMQDEIDSTIKKRRTAVASSFNSEIAKAESRLKNAKGERNKAKEKGVGERIAEETAELVGQNKELKNNIKALIRSAKLPFICNIRTYYRLYFTKTVGDVFVCALAFIIFFLLIPMAVYILLPWEKASVLPDAVEVGITFFACIVVFLLIYILIGHFTKGKNKETLLSIKSLKEQIAGNDKQIRKITRSIKSHAAKDDSEYGLGAFDDKINTNQSQLDDMLNRKNAALSEFESKTKNEITEEIQARLKPAIDSLNARYSELDAEKSSYEKAVQEGKLFISTEYEAYLDKRYAQEEKIDELLEIMQSGQAATVGEAIKFLEKQEV